MSIDFAINIFCFPAIKTQHLAMYDKDKVARTDYDVLPTHYQVARPKKHWNLPGHWTDDSIVGVPV